MNSSLTRPTARMIAAVAAILGIALPLIVAAAFDDRVDTVEDRFEFRTDALSDRLAAVDASGTAGGDARAAELAERLDTITARLDDIAARLDDLAAAVDTLEADALADEPEQQAAAPRPTTTTTAPPAQRVTATGGDPFAALAACESTGDHDGQEPHRIDPAAVNPTGKYRGAFQFDLPTWRSVGGTGDPAAHPYDAQLARARDLQAARGWAPWPRCSELLGLR